MSRFARLSFGCLCLLALFSAVARAADEKGNVIKPEEAKDNVGKEVIVEFVVVGGRLLEDKGLCFLNSSSDRDDPDGFTVVIKKAALSKYKDDAKIDDPSEHFSQKKIRVSGKVTKYKEKAQIEVTSPSQIKLIEEEEAKPADDEKKM